VTYTDEQLTGHVVDHLCAEQPEAVAGLPDAEIERRAALAVARARSFGFSSPETVAAFAVLMFLVSPDFARQAAIAAVLADAAVPERQRLESLFSRTSEEDWEEAARLGSVWPS
jgi:hypothetical protein